MIDIRYDAHFDHSSTTSTLTPQSLGSFHSTFSFFISLFLLFCHLFFLFISSLCVHQILIGPRRDGLEGMQVHTHLRREEGGESQNECESENIICVSSVCPYLQAASYHIISCHVLSCHIISCLFLSSVYSQSFCLLACVCTLLRQLIAILT